MTTPAINIDPEDLTLDEVEEVEDLIGGDVTEAFAKGQPKAKAIKALVFVLMRRDNPAITMEEVGKLKLSIITGGSEGDESGEG